MRIEKANLVYITLGLGECSEEKTLVICKHKIRANEDKFEYVNELNERNLPSCGNKREVEQIGLSTYSIFVIIDCD